LGSNDGVTSQPGRPDLPRPLDELVATALGEVHRDDPALPRTGGPAGNARLTAWAGVLLLVLFLVECFTLLGLQQMISVHILIGTMLVPLALLKTATTGWRIARYYAGDPAYRRAGPPPLVLRLLGPLVVLTALAVLGSGLALVPLGDGAHDTLFTFAGQRIDPVTIHQACFAAWLVVVGAHTLTRLVPAARLAAGRSGPSTVAGGVRRATVLAVTVALGAVVGVAVLDASASWTHHGGFSQGFDDDQG
jgi:hypothetical protein